MAHRGSGSYAHVDRATVTAWLDGGRRLDEIEHDLLQQAALSDEQRAVLWLYAWGETYRRERAQACGRLLFERSGW